MAEIELFPHLKLEDAKFHKLDVQNAAKYVESLSQVASLLGGSSSEWKVEEIGDGNMNFVFIIRGTQNSVIIKQAVPYIRCVGEGWPLTRTRAYFEYEALVEEAKHCPQHVPKVYHYDHDNSLIVMQHIQPHIILRKGLIKGIEYPHLAEHLSEFLSSTLFKTSSLALNTKDKMKRVATFSANHSLIQTTEQVIFTDPYITAQYNRWTSPQLDDDAKAIREDGALKNAISQLKLKFLQNTEALIHGDLHTGSIMCTTDSTYVIDPEFAFYGPMGFDIGALIGNIFLSYFSQDGHATTSGSRDNYKKWLITLAEDVWNKFSVKFIKLWNTQHTGHVYAPSFFNDAQSLAATQQEYMKQLFQDSLGFAGAKMIRRIVGIAHVEDLESIQDVELRAKCERRALRCARELLVNRHKYSSISEVTNLIAQ